MDVVFLTLQEILEIHADQIERYGGDSAIRDMGLLESATAMPHAGFGGSYLHADIYEMAAAYLFHITKNHPFVDGNKRTGAAASLVFLLMNGLELDADEDELESLVRSVACGASEKVSVASFLRTHSHPLV